MSPNAKQGRVYHHHGVGGHYNLISRHGNYRSYRTGETVNIHRLVSLVSAELIIDRHALHDRSAKTVYVNIDLCNIARRFKLPADMLRAGLTFYLLTRPPIPVVAFNVGINVQVQRFRGIGVHFQIKKIVHDFSPPPDVSPIMLRFVIGS